MNIPCSLSAATAAWRRVALVLLSTCAVALAAPASVRHFDVAAGPAERTLKTFSQQAGVELAYVADAVRGTRTNGIRGEFPPAEALEKMLQGTPLVIVRDQTPGAFAVRRADGAGAAATPPRRPAVSGAGTGTVEGRIYHVTRGEYIGNARVTVAGTGEQAFSDSTGFYRLTRVPAGRVDLSVFYTGMSPQQQQVTLPAGGVVRQDFQLAPTDLKVGEEAAIKLGEYVVAASKEMDESAIAINEQRFAPNMVRVVATDEFGANAEGNVGDFLKFLPGVTIDYTGGEARQVQLNGMPSDYTPITVGGFDLASASSGNTNRTIELEQVSLNNTSRVELQLSPTPDSPGNALAGSVNLVPRVAFQRAKPAFNYAVFLLMRDNEKSLRKTPGPLRNPERKVHPGFNFSYVMPVNKRFGFTLSGASTTEYVSQDMEIVGWAGAYEKTNGTTLPVTTPDKPYLIGYTNRETAKTTSRASLGATLDFKLAPNDLLSLRFQYATFDAGWLQRDLDFDVGQVLPGNFSLDHTHGAAGKGTITNSSAGSRKSGTTWMPSLTYRHNGPVWKLELGASHSEATNHYRDIDQGRFNGVTTSLKNVTVSFDDNFYLRPGRVTVTTATGAPVDPYRLDAFTYTSSSSGQKEATDVKRVLYANAARRFDFRVPLVLKSGLDVRQNTRDLESGSSSYSFVGADGKGGTADDNAAFLTDPVNSLRPAPYGFPPVQRPSNWTAWEFYQANPTSFTTNPVTTRNNRVNGSKHVSEYVSAVFLRADVQLFRNRMKIVTGVRAEQTNDKGEGPLNDPTRNFQRDASGAVVVDSKGSPVLVNPSSSMEASELTRISRGAHTRKEYLDWFPSINVGYNVTEKLIARAAYYWSIGRPNLNQYAGGITLPNTEAGPSTSNRISVNNPGIKPWTGRSTRVSLEYYFGGVGQLSVGGFYREIKNFISSSVTPATSEFLENVGLDPAVYRGYDVSTQVNSPNPTRIKGFDIQYSQSLTFLPHWARGLSLYGNFTRNRVDGVPASNFSGYIPRTANGGIGLDRGKYKVRVDWNWRSRARRGGVSATANSSIGPNTYTWSQSWLFIDVNAEYRFTRRFALFAALRNIRDQAEDFEAAGPLTPPEAQFRQTQKFGSLWTIGVKGQF